MTYFLIFFQNPQEPEKWSGIRDATKPGKKCAQINPYGKREIEGSEDCLYLNVYTPVLPADKLEKLPVLVFFHGGRYIIGCGDYYRPEYLIRHNVILVTFNYRLHILGFLCLNIPEVPGNVALKDSVMALRWVKRNINKFSGDQNNITAIGESAGGATTMSLIISEMGEGLFNKIIVQSSTNISDLFMVEEDPIEKARQISSYLGQNILEPKKLYDCFLNAPINDLIYAVASAELSRPPSIINPFFLAVVEKKFNGVEQFFNEYPIVTVRENRFKKVPMIYSVNTHEGALFLNKDEHGNIIFEENFQYFIPRYLSIKHNSPKAIKFVNSLRDYYFRGRKMDNSTKKEYLDLISDHYLTRDLILSLEIMSKFNKDIYLCRFSYEGNLNTRIMRNLGIKGTTHGDLIQYIFYRNNKASKCSEADKKIVDILTEAWCNFAKFG